MNKQNLDKGLLTITMNRPDRRNALNPDMMRGLVEADFVKLKSSGTMVSCPLPN